MLVYFLSGHNGQAGPAKIHTGLSCSGRAQALGTSSASFPGSLAGNNFRSRIARNWSSAHIKDATITGSSFICATVPAPVDICSHLVHFPSYGQSSVFLAWNWVHIWCPLVDLGALSPVLVHKVSVEDEKVWQLSSAVMFSQSYYSSMSTKPSFPDNPSILNRKACTLQLTGLIPGVSPLQHLGRGDISKATW